MRSLPQPQNSPSDENRSRANSGGRILRTAGAPTHAAERARRFGAAGATWFSPSAVFAAGLHEVAVDFHAVPVGLGRSAAFYYPYQY